MLALFYNKLIADFKINVDGIINFNRDYLADIYGLFIDKWYKDLFEETFDKLEEHFIENSLNISI